MKAIDEINRIVKTAGIPLKPITYFNDLDDDRSKKRIEREKSRKELSEDRKIVEGRRAARRAEEIKAQDRRMLEMIRRKSPRLPVASGTNAQTNYVQSKWSPPTFNDVKRMEYQGSTDDISKLKSTQYMQWLNNGKKGKNPLEASSDHQQKTIQVSENKDNPQNDKTRAPIIDVIDPARGNSYTNSVPVKVQSPQLAKQIASQTTTDGRNTTDNIQPRKNVTEVKAPVISTPEQWNNYVKKNIASGNITENHAREFMGNLHGLIGRLGMKPSGVSSFRNSSVRPAGQVGMKPVDVSSFRKRVADLIRPNVMKLRGYADQNQEESLDENGFNDFRADIKRKIDDIMNNRRRYTQKDLDDIYETWRKRMEQNRNYLR